LQMKYKPMPRYRSGIVVGDLPKGRTAQRQHPVGVMFMQPSVETPDRRRLKLDDAIGPWFAVIGVGVDPATQLSAQDHAWWHDLGASFVEITSPRTRRLGAEPQPEQLATGTIMLTDVDGAFRDWLLAHPTNEIIVLRPDRYVAAVCDRAGLALTTAALRNLLREEAPGAA
jgi:3-(3-hydroxy-phenyl)propionate hydroxylase